MYLRIMNKKYFYLITVLLFSGCQLIVGDKMMASELRSNGSAFTGYSLGRFFIQVPNEFQLVSDRFIVNYTDIEETHWKNISDSSSEREGLWRGLIAKIKGEELPEGIQEHILEEKNFSKGNIWGKGVLYYSDPYDNSVISWTVLRDYKSHGVMFTIEGTTEHRKLIDEIFDKVVDEYKPDNSGE